MADNMDDDLIRATTSRKVKPKHNPTDFDSFRSFTERHESMYGKITENSVRQEKITQVKLWDEKTPNRWKGASLRRMGKTSAKQVLRVLRGGPSSFYLYGPSGAGKSYVAYAIARTYVASGWSTFSRVKIISEDSFLSYASTGYVGENNYTEMTNGQYNLFIIDGVERTSYSPKEIILWERFVDYVYSHSLSVVFTSSFIIDDFMATFSQSTKGKLESIIDSQRCIEVDSAGSIVPNVAGGEESEAGREPSGDEMGNKPGSGKLSGRGSKSRGQSGEGTQSGRKSGSTRKKSYADFLDE